MQACENIRTPHGAVSSGQQVRSLKELCQLIFNHFIQTRKLVTRSWHMEKWARRQRVWNISGCWAGQFSYRHLTDRNVSVFPSSCNNLKSTCWKEILTFLPPLILQQKKKSIESTRRTQRLCFWFWLIYENIIISHFYTQKPKIFVFRIINE